MKKNKNKLIYTYIIQDIIQGYVKIGFSRNIEARLKRMQTDNANSLRLIGLIEGNCEKILHNTFAASKIKGEWFECNEELHDWLKKEFNKKDMIRNFKIKKEYPKGWLYRRKKSPYWFAKIVYYKGHKGCGKSTKRKEKENAKRWLNRYLNGWIIEYGLNEIK